MWPFAILCAVIAVVCIVLKITDGIRFGKLIIGDLYVVHGYGEENSNLFLDTDRKIFDNYNVKYAVVRVHNVETPSRDIKSCDIVKKP